MNSQDKIMDIGRVMDQIRLWKQDGLKVVFSNGCFDVIHLGHIDYLEKARAFGDKLVIGLNSDDSVSLLKGPGRPIMDQIARARVLAAMEFVDAVIFFGEQTPFELISRLVPDVLVKGDDYLAEDIVGSDIVKANGGEVVTIPLVMGYSTSRIIEKIKSI